MRNEAVVLLHGIARSARSLSKLAESLDRNGFRTLNLDYPSRAHSLDDLVAIIHDPIERFLGQRGETVHFVTHSMGGLLARAYITRYRPPRLGRMVMLGPPNQGSEIADLLANHYLYKRIFGPAGAQLRTHQDQRLQALLGVIDYPVGVIAGTLTLDPLSWLIIPGPNDGKVSVARTRVHGMTEHLIVKTTHALMMRNAEVIRQSVTFLQQGQFLSIPAG